MMNEYDKQIYKYYMGKELDIDNFIKNLNRDNYHKLLSMYWGKFLNLNKDSAFLDLGCGWGDFLLFLKSQGFENLKGVDASSQQVEICNKLDLKHVVCEDLFIHLDKLIESGQKFDVISALNLLEHIEKDLTIPLLSKIKKLLHPTGQLLLEIPNANSPFGTRTRYWDFTHKTSFTPTSLTQVLTVAGFEDIIFKEKVAVPKNLFGIIRLSLWSIIRLKIKAYLLIEKGSYGIDVYSQDMLVVAKPRIL